MFEVSLHQEAEQELGEAAVFYEVREPGLGDLFLDAVESSFRLIKEYPQIGKSITGAHRRYSIPRFPFGVVYRVEDLIIVVLAIAHSSRRPGYWRGRN